VKPCPFTKRNSKGKTLKKRILLSVIFPWKSRLCGKNLILPKVEETIFFLRKTKMRKKWPSGVREDNISRKGFSTCRNEHFVNLYFKKPKSLLDCQETKFQNNKSHSGPYLICWYFRFILAQIIVFLYPL